MSDLATRKHCSGHGIVVKKGALLVGLPRLRGDKTPEIAAGEANDNCLREA